ncbi:MAG: hypothetical protein ABEI74_01740 [Candidatus Pacearchaeota archaeon]
MKKVSGDYGLEDEDLGILAMKSILPEKGDRQLHLNIYSSYPEKESDTSYIEVWSQDGGLQGDFGVSYQRNNPMQLLKVSEFDIEVFQMNRFNKTLSRESRLPADKISDKSSNSLDGFQRDNPFNINGQRSSLPLGKIREITKMFTHFRTL